MDFEFEQDLIIESMQENERHIHFELKETTKNYKRYEGEYKGHVIIYYKSEIGVMFIAIDYKSLNLNGYCKESEVEQLVLKSL